MSRFLKALEQVERERATRDARHVRSDGSAEVWTLPPSEEPRAPVGSGTNQEGESSSAATLRPFVRRRDWPTWTSDW